MSKVLTGCAFALGLLLVTVGQSYAGCHAGPVQKSPVQAPPAPAAPMARAEGGYRTFSYEPGTYRVTGRRAGMGRPAYLDARSKALGW